ncbi:MAG: AbrB/MazE/SpoVT family DNA-binding domain-containing protein [Nitrosotalea sp.]
MSIVSLNPTWKYGALEITLQKQRSRSYNGAIYYKYRVTIPAQIVKQLDLEGGDKLDVFLYKILS